MAHSELNLLIDFQLTVEAEATLKKMGTSVTRVIPNDQEPRPLPTEIISPVDAILCTFPPTNLADMKRLKFIQIASSGYSQLFGLKLAERGIRASNASGVFDAAIAEWNIAMIINLARDLRGLIRNQEAAKFDRDKRFQREVRGSRLGIWGYGGVGRQTARLAKAMGLEVWVYAHKGARPRPKHYLVEGVGDPHAKLPDRVFTRGSEIEFLSSLDFLVFTMPLTPQSQGIIGERELRALPHTAYILNPSRGPLIQEQPLIRALQEGWIAGAAIDAHYAYPLPPEHALWRLPNVILSPHISGSSEMPYFAQRVSDIFVQNVALLLADEPLLNELPPAELT